MVSVLLTFGLTEPLEEEARASSCHCRCLQFLNPFESRSFGFGLTIIPLFNRVKQRYACRPTSAGRTEPVAINWAIFVLVARKWDPESRSVFPADAPE
jgi:hypothetical protein